jgi:protein-S-isoprenylcysteine O-methyltransferase Ste14
MLIPYGNFLFRYRNVLFPCVLLLLLIGFKPRPLAGNANIDLWMNLAGILIILAGQAVRAAVIGLVYIKRGGVNKQIYAETLVTTGIFSHCRNPLYVGNLLILGGYLVLHNNPWVYLLAGIFFLVSYAAIVQAEEAYLRSKFGAEFENYCNNVNRWAIRFQGLGETLRSMRFNWQRVISKDYTTMLTWFVTILLIVTEEHIVREGWAESYTFMATALLLVIVAAMAAFAVRTLKKNGRLGGKRLS